MGQSQEKLKKPQTLKPLGHRLLVRPLKVKEETSKGGIILNDATVKADQLAQVSGEVIDVGDTCWKDLGNETISFTKDGVTHTKDVGKPWCKVGDIVYYQRYSGMRIPDEDGTFREDVLLLGDQDITALVIKE